MGNNRFSRVPGAGISAINAENVTRILELGASVCWFADSLSKNAAELDYSLIKIEGVDDPKAATSVYPALSITVSVEYISSFIDSILARRSHLSIAHNERFEERRFE